MIEADSASANVRQADDFGNFPRGEGGALRRGLRLLEELHRRGEDGARIVDLCRVLTLERAPVYRLLDTLIECGHVRREGRYRYVADSPSTRRASNEGADVASKMSRLLAPALARVSEGCGDATFAVVREGHSAWCVARHIGTYPVQMLAVQVGSRQPLGIGAAGLAVLAALADPEAEASIRSHGEALARYGGMNTERLRLLVRASRERGWSVVGNHAVRGVLGVGRALLSAEGHVLAGISVASEMERMTPQRQRHIAALMLDALGELVL